MKEAAGGQMLQPKVESQAQAVVKAARLPGQFSAPHTPSWYIREINWTAAGTHTHKDTLYEPHPHTVQLPKTTQAHAARIDSFQLPVLAI